MSTRSSKRARKGEAADTSTKKEEEDRKDDGDDGDKDAVIAELRAEIESLKNGERSYYCSRDCVVGRKLHHVIPPQGMPARHVKERIVQQHELDNKPRLNTSSYVNVVQEPEEVDVAILGLNTNLADGSVYPSSVRLHDTVVNMIAQLWNAPAPPAGMEYSGAGTVGSTEACLLGGLALKFRWRAWYQNKNDLSGAEVMGVIPNIVISSCYQAAWEKFFRYFDVTPRFVKPSLVKDKMRVDPSKIGDLCDDKTIAVVCILGNHYNGAYDPVWEINDVVEKINDDKNWQIGIHVDAASGGFVAPFQEGLPPFDFRLSQVQSMSASGHKFGESCCGTGWLVFRHRENLAQHVAVSVTYLGGKSDSMTLNFSRPATAAYVQFYKFLRLGMEGYRNKVKQQMHVAKYLRDHFKKCKTADGKDDRFEVLDGGDEHCLPVVAARLNPALKLKYDDINLQHALAEYHWYVSGYHLSFEDFNKEGAMDTLCSDVPEEATMFRVVVKSNLTLYLAQDLVAKIDETLPLLDQRMGREKSIRQLAGEQAEKAEKEKRGGAAAAGKLGMRRRSTHAAC